MGLASALGWHVLGVLVRQCTWTGEGGVRQGCRRDGTFLGHGTRHQGVVLAEDSRVEQLLLWRELLHFFRRGW